jgi:hypothetical protein
LEIDAGVYLLCLSGDFLSDLPPMKKAWSYKGTCHVVVGLKGGVGIYTAD